MGQRLVGARAREGLSWWQQRRPMAAWMILATSIGLAGAVSAGSSGSEHAAVAFTLGEVNAEIGADDLHAGGLTGAGVTVAVIDTGVDPVPGLDGPGKLIAGPDLSFEAGVPELHGRDSFGHGTVMASIIAGNDGDTDGYVGVAPGAQILSVKVADNTGAVDVSQVIAAIDWVIAHKDDAGMNVRVLNLSYRTDSQQSHETDPLVAAVERAWRAGIVVVVSAGNDGEELDELGNPAGSSYVITVAAHDEDYRGDGSLFTSVGDKRHPDIAAPGSSILGLVAPGSRLAQTYRSAFLDDRFFRGSGTSQAAAITSGAVALLLEQRPELTPDQVKALLILSADDVSSDGKSTPIVQGKHLHEFLDPRLDDRAGNDLAAAQAAEEAARASFAEVESIVTAASDRLAWAGAELDRLAGDKAPELRLKAEERLVKEIEQYKVDPLKHTLPAPLLLKGLDSFLLASDLAEAAMDAVHAALADVEAAEAALVAPVQALAATEAAYAAAQDAVDAAEDAVPAAETAVKSAVDAEKVALERLGKGDDAVESAVKLWEDAKKDLVDAQKLVTEAQAKVVEAEKNLAKQTKQSDIDKAALKVDEMEDKLAVAVAVAERDEMVDAVADAAVGITAAQEALTPLRHSVDQARLTVAARRVQLAHAETGVILAEDAVDAGKLAVEDAERLVKSAEEVVKDAEKRVSDGLKHTAYELVVAARAASEGTKAVERARKDVDNAVKQVADAEKELYVDKPARRAARIEKASNDWGRDKLEDINLDKVVGAGRLDVARAASFRTVEVEQRHVASTGSGSLEAARGSDHVVLPDGSLLQGEVTFTGSSWSGSSWSGSSWSGSSWSGSSWSGSSWSGSSWSGSSWSGSSWSGSSWSGAAWS